MSQQAESDNAKRGALAPILSARGARRLRGASMDVITFWEAGLLEKPPFKGDFHPHIHFVKGLPLEIPRHLRTPVYLESHVRLKEWDAAWAAGKDDSEKKKSTSKAPYALVQHYVPGLASETTSHSSEQGNYIRILGVFESSAIAHALVDAIMCPIRKGFPPLLQARKWQKFSGWDAMNLAKPFHFVILCHEQPVEIYTLDAHELPNHSPVLGSMVASYPTGCKVPQQEFGVVCFRAWWSHGVQANDKRLSSPFVNKFARDSEHVIAKIKAVQEVYACLGTLSSANEHAVEILERVTKDSDSNDSGNKVRTKSWLIAVVKLYEWLELPYDGCNDILWQDMRLRRTVETRREDKERHHPPQRRPEKDETNIQGYKRQLYETLQKIRHGRFEIKQEETLAHRSSNLHPGDEKASLIEGRLNRLRDHVAKTNAGLQDLNRMAIISGSSGRISQPPAAR